MQLSDAQWQQVRALFEPPAENASDERRQIRRAVALLETEVGAITGTWRDLAENVEGAGLPGQLDCISESRNTTTYLALMQGDGLLRWHRVQAREVRTRFIFSHWSAVIEQQPDGQRYAVDSWYLDNGEPPDILPLADWKSGRRFDRGQEDFGDQ